MFCRGLTRSRRRPRKIVPWSKLMVCSVAASKIATSVAQPPCALCAEVIGDSLIAQLTSIRRPRPSLLLLLLLLLAFFVLVAAAAAARLIRRGRLGQLLPLLKLLLKLLKLLLKLLHLIGLLRLLLPQFALLFLYFNDHRYCDADSCAVQA